MTSLPAHKLDLETRLGYLSRAITNAKSAAGVSITAEEVDELEQKMEVRGLSLLSSTNELHRGKWLSTQYEQKQTLANNCFHTLHSIRSRCGKCGLALFPFSILLSIRYEQKQTHLLQFFFSIHTPNPLPVWSVTYSCISFASTWQFVIYFFYLGKIGGSHSASDSGGVASTAACRSKSTAASGARRGFARYLFSVCLHMPTTTARVSYSSSSSPSLCAHTCSPMYSITHSNATTIILPHHPHCQSRRYHCWSHMCQSISWLPPCLTHVLTDTATRVASSYGKHASPYCTAAAIMTRCWCARYGTRSSPSSSRTQTRLSSSMFVLVCVRN